MKSGCINHVLVLLSFTFAPCWGTAAAISAEKSFAWTCKVDPNSIIDELAWERFSGTKNPVDFDVQRNGDAFQIDFNGNFFSSEKVNDKNQLIAEIESTPSRNGRDFTIHLRVFQGPTLAYVVTLYTDLLRMDINGEDPMAQLTCLTR